jgi:acyl-CoA reductase-like NAD-dependent aldehyde dehydrogenase
VENRAGARGGQHGGRQAVGADPARHAAPGRAVDVAPSARRDQRGHRHGPGGGRGARRRSQRGLHRFHRLHGGWDTDRRQGAAQLKRVNLELGGIDPLIVFEDADLDIAVPGAAWARYLNAGQVCTSAKRIYVVEKIAKPFIERFVAEAQTIRVGNPMDPGTDMGPLISEKARARVEDQVKRAVAQGAKVMAGGKRLDVGPGYFYAPTVLSGVKVDHPVVCEEVFGPIASIEVVKDADQAIARAAQSDYGLGANIYTQNLTWAMRAMSEIKAGTFWINDPLTDNDAAPFGGMRKSGMGRELGEEGLDAFRETKHVHLDFVPEKKSSWFPYRTRAKEIPE